MWLGLDVGSRWSLVDWAGLAGGPASGEGHESAGGERVGPVLSWNPATGSLQLSRQATQRLFHRLGGRLTERGGSNLTVFFPVADQPG